MNGTNNKLEAHGTLLLGFANACVNLNIIVGPDAQALVKDIEPNAWYPLARFLELNRVLLESYKNPEPIFEQVGQEMMHMWYVHGPGKSIIKRGVDFLTFQSGSQGYQSVIRGPQKLVGEFKLIDFDEQQGFARIQTTTIFTLEIERGVLVGGMSAPGDLDFVDATSEYDHHRKLRFHNVSFSPI